jgi:predicted metalloprotease
LETEGHRRSDNFEDRGVGAGRQVAAAGLPIALLSGLFRTIGPKGILILVAVLGIGYFLAPASVKQLLSGLLTGEPSGALSESSPDNKTCAASPGNGKACDFSRVVLASTEDVWSGAFKSGALPRYGAEPDAYRMPTLVVFSRGVATGGCGNATSAVGPFYCPADRKLYIDPSFYAVMEQRLKAPGDFAQAYVLAHEVGHHVQNLIGANEVRARGEGRNQTSVRLELQADCLAGVWGHSARSSLVITDADLSEAVNAAHAIGDDALGHADQSQFTHGSSAQRMRWFKRGFESGDARQCDTFSAQPGQL